MNLIPRPYRDEHDLEAVRAVLVEALRRLRASGVRRAAVGADSDNPAAQRLYQSVGFEPVRKLRMYERPDTKGLT